MTITTADEFAVRRAAEEHLRTALRARGLAGDGVLTTAITAYGLAMARCGTAVAHEVAAADAVGRAHLAHPADRGEPLTHKIHQP